MNDQQIELIFNSTSLVSAGKMNSDGSDIRVLDRKGNQLSFFIESGTMNSSTTSLWIKTDSIVGYSSDTIYLYYGKTSSTNLSSASATFDFFDDFNGTSLGSQWSTCGAGTAGVGSGELTITSTSSNDITIETTSAIDGPYWLEAKVNSHSGGKSILGVLNTSGDGYSAILDGSSLSLARLSSGSCFTSATFGTGSTTTSVNGVWSFAWKNVGQQELIWPGGSRNGSDNTYSISTSADVFIGQSGGGTLKLDWVRARKVPTGTFSLTMGTEVAMNYTIQPSYEAPLCEGGDLKLSVDTVTGARYRWTGPNSFSSNLQSPVITNVSTSDAGLYIAYVEIPSSCASKTSTVNVTISARAQGGTVAGSETVCGGSNVGILSLTGHTGNVLRWDSSTSASGPWYPIVNTDLNQTYQNLDTTMHYRAIVVNGNCSLDSSTIGKITVTPPSVGGTVSGTDTVCSGSNSGTLNLSGYTGDIIRWESSTNGFLWSNIVNRSAVHAYSNLTTTTFYRAVVKNGLCDEEVSSDVTIQVDANSVGGSATGATSVCEGSNSGTVSVTGETGDVIRWEYSFTGSNPWTAIQSTSKSYTYNNISKTTYFRAVVQNGKCSFANSSPVTVTVIPKSDGGELSGGTTVCESSNSGTLSLNNYTGTIQNWQYFDKNSSGWVNITNTSDFLNWGGLNDTTYYRAQVANGSCASAYSDTAVINVNRVTQSGYLTGVEAVCEGNNSGSVSLNNYRGEVIAWEESSNGFSPWKTINNTTDALTFNNLTGTTYYRTRVKNGVCASATTLSFKVEVSETSVGGKAGPDVSVCEGSNFGLISLSDYTGDITKWQYTTDLTGSWTDIANFTNRQEYRDLSSTTYYRAIVQNGACADSSSNVTTITVDALTEIGDIVGDTAFCDSTNEGIVALTGHKGDILRWESSTNGRSGWQAISETNDTLIFNDLESTTFFRAIIKNGSCSQEASLISVVEVSDPSDAGEIVLSDSTVCEDNNFGVMNLTNQSGSIVKWQKRSGASWEDIINTTPQEFFYGLTETTRYRAVVRNGNCPEDTSRQVAVYVSEVSVGGELPETVQMCAGQTPATLKVTGKKGLITGWEYSGSRVGPWAELPYFQESLTVPNLVANQYYRVIVKNGACGEVASTVGEVEVATPSKAGELVGGGSLCQDGNASTVVLKNSTGGVVDWEQAPTVVGPWVTLQHTASTYNILNLNTQRYYRAIVQNGICPNDTSNVVAYRVNPNPVADFEVSDSCYGKIATFTDKSSIVSGNIADYLWTFSDGFISTKSTFRKAFLNPGEIILTLQVRSDSGCTGNSTQVINVLDAPLANFRFEDDLGNGAICTNDTLKLIDISQFSGTGAIQPLWDFGDGTSSTESEPRKQYDAAGTYPVKLVANTPFGCSDSITRFVTVFKNDPVSAGTDAQVSKGIPFKLFGEGALVYEWSPREKLNNPNLSSPVATIHEPTTFVVQGTDENGCLSTDSVTYTVVEDFRVIPNNVITPEGNGENDTWVVKNIDTYPNNTVSVFDRWGRMVFSADNYQNDWGGTNVDGALLVDGTYYYVIEFKDVNEVYKGAITVIRNRN
jgi:gliding motility-associated-like protein